MKIVFTACVTATILTACNDTMEDSGKGDHGNLTLYFNVNNVGSIEVPEEIQDETIAQ